MSQFCLTEFSVHPLSPDLKLHEYMITTIAIVSTRTLTFPFVYSYRSLQLEPSPRLIPQEMLQPALQLQMILLITSLFAQNTLT